MNAVQLPAGSERLFDVVVANILRGPLLELQPRLTAYCKPGGRLALSGILTEQVNCLLSSQLCNLAQAASTFSCAWTVFTCAGSMKRAIASLKHWHGGQCMSAADVWTATLLEALTLA